MSPKPRRDPTPPRRSANVARGSSAETATPERAPVFPALRELFDPAGPYLVPLLLLVLGRAALAVILPLASEDAYITFRYARNLVAGHGLVFNPGERVMGFTSPAWTLWSALGIALVRDPVLWTRATSLITDGLTLVVVGSMLARQAGRGAAWTFTLFFAAWPYFSAVSASGMENPAMLTLIALGAALAGARSPLTGPALGLLALWRPEGLAAAFVLALWSRWRDRLVALGAALAGYAALAWYFGSPLAQSVTAKAALYGTPGPWAGRFWWEWVVPATFGRWWVIGETNNLFPIVVLYSPAAAVGAWELFRRQRTTPLAAAAAACLVVWLGYIVSGASYFYWYFTVPLGGIALLAAVGFPRIVSGRAIPLAAIALVLGMWTVTWPLYLGRAQNEYLGFGGAARLLHDRVRPGDVVMLEPIGIVGWQCPVRIVDEVGLVSPEVLRRRLEGPGWYSDIALARRPDWLVVRRGVVTSGVAFAGAGNPFRSPAERDSLFARYALEAEVDPVSGANALRIYRRIR